MAVCVVSAGMLVACGGGDSQSPVGSDTQLLANGEACNPAWNSSTAYVGGNTVSYGGRNYSAAYWTQGDNPSTKSGAAGSGQPWISGFTCGGTATTTTTKAATTTTKAGTTTTKATTTTTSSSCSAVTWSAGVNYALGTVVKYAPNGNFYKEVNAGTNGSDGTDPTISTWYWSVTTCSGGGTTTTTKTGTTTTASSGFALTENMFNSWFPNKISFYTYTGFMNAVNSYYPAFGKTGSDTVRKQEIAAFFGNTQQESDALRAVREYNTANWPLYCSSGNCGGKQYYGRGPMQLSWDYNYTSAGNGMGVDLLNNPDLVATDEGIAWRTALWYWMTQSGQAGSTPHNTMVNSMGFGLTIKAINGGLECGQPAGNAYWQEMTNRGTYYTNFTNSFGVATGGNLTC